MDVMTVKVLLLTAIGLLILATLYGELRPRRRVPGGGERAGGGRGR